MKIAVLGVGTELTTGQILNRNACWISEKMKDLGVLSSAHLTVPDDRSLILKALEFLSQSADILFVTGGLGPTSDDFTREVISEWTQSPLEWHEPSWQHIQTRLASRGVEIREIQKQQAYFPKNATVLFNSHGTANGFFLKYGKIEICVLPGPPREIQAIWDESLQMLFEQKTNQIDRFVTRSWDTLGLGESDVAALCEEALKSSGLEIGYRVHHPYVEVKVSHFKSQTKLAEPYIHQLDSILNPITALRDGQDAAQILIEKLRHHSQIYLHDTCSGSFLCSRLIPDMSPLLENKSFHYSSCLSKQSASLDSLILSLEGLSLSEARATLTYKGQVRTTLLTSPYQSMTMATRSRQYLAELAMIFWSQELG